MRKLLNTLYVMTAEAYLTLDGKNVVISKKATEIARIPLHTLEGIVCFTYPGASPALMGYCADAGIDLCFYSPTGKFLARTMGSERGNVFLRTEQYRIAASENDSCRIARLFIVGKIYNSRWVLERAIRDHQLRIPVDKFKNNCQFMANSIKNVRTTDSLELLRGYEGEAAQNYFNCFDDVILQQKESFSFKGRNKRPPLDNVNALLSFAYSILAKECAAALQSTGLDPYIGFLHRLRPGRISLALDLMEELRSVIADRFVINCINKKKITDKHFEKQESGAVLLTEEGRRAFFKYWQLRKQEQLTHPFLKIKIEWGLVPYVQAQLLARTIRGDLEEYPPFFWK